ncbi:MAG: hypothetical protein AABX07_00560 [Nanoarchaeota archaeon]
MIEEYFLANLQNYIPIASLISGLALGDFLIFLAMLAGAGKANIGTIFAFAFLGGIVHDLLFFAAAKSNIFRKITKKMKLKEKKIRILRTILNMTKKNMFFTLFIAKFIYGVRDVTILYYAHNESRLKKYIITTISVEVLWLSSILSIGWFAGRGFSEILKVFKGLEKALLLIVIIIVGSLILHKIIFKAFNKIFNIKLKKMRF